MRVESSKFSLSSNAAGSALRPGGWAGGGAGGAGGASLQGPLGIARMGGDVARADARRLFEFGALLSLNLAVFNALPLPGLDGWQMGILAVESIALRGRKLPEAAKGAANAAAAALFAVAFGRVLLSDLQAAVGTGAAGAMGGGGGAAAAVMSALRPVAEAAPSIGLGLLLSAAVAAYRSPHERDASGEGTATTPRAASPSKRAGGGRGGRSDQRAAGTARQGGGRGRGRDRSAASAAPKSDGRWWRGGRRPAPEAGRRGSGGRGGRRRRRSPWRSRRDAARRRLWLGRRAVVIGAQPARPPPARQRPSRRGTEEGR